MIISLGRGPAPAREIDAAEFFLGCHARIRNFTALAGKLVDSADADAALLADAARSVHRFYTIGLPLHAEDEDVSLAPRLRAHHQGDEVDAALTRMTAQHLAVDALAADVAALCKTVGDDPSTLHRLAPALSRAVRDMRALWDDHLGMEESVIFPALRRLPADVQSTVLAECRARRQRPDVVEAMRLPIGL